MQAVEDRVDRLGRGALAVGVLDAQQEFAAGALGVEPVEQSRPRPADMQEAGGRGREAGDDGGHGGRLADARLKNKGDGPGTARVRTGRPRSERALFEVRM